MTPGLTQDQIESAVRSGVSSALGSKINLSPSSTAGSGSAGSFLEGGPAGLITGAARMFANGITSAKDAVTDTIEIWRNASNLGINFGNDAVGLRASIGTTRLSVDEYAQVMEKLRQGMGAFGGTLSQGTLIFNQLAYQFGESQFAENLLKAGFTVKEYQEILALTNTGVRRDYANNKEAFQQASEAAFKVAQEMDRVAQMTGLSRKQQSDAMFERQQDARLQAMFRQASIDGNTNLKVEYDKVANQFRSLGAPVENLIRDMFLGGRLSAQSIQMQVALGGENAAAMRAAVNRLKEASRPGVSAAEREAAQREFQRVYVDIAKYLSDPNTLTKIQLAQGEWADLLGKTALAGRITLDQIQAEKDRVRGITGNVITDLEAYDNIARQAALLSQGKLSEDTKNAGSRTTELYVTIENRLKGVSTTLYRMIDAGNEAAGRSESVTKALDALESVRKEGGTTFTKEFSDKINNAIDQLKTGNLSSKDVALLVSGLEKEVSGFIKNTGVDIGKSVVNESVEVGKKVAQGFGEGILEFLKGYAKTTAPTPPPRHSGTIGETGKLKEVGSPIVQLKDKETVFTEEQLINFANNAAGSHLNTLLDIAKAFEPSKTTEVPVNSYANMFAEIFKDIQTKISPVNIPNTVSFDRESIENLGTRLSGTVESVASAMTDNDIQVPPIVEPNYDKIISSVVGEFQKSIPNITDTFSKGMSDLATIIPTIGQNQARDLIRIIPTEIQQARYESQRQEDSRRRVEPTVVESPTPTQAESLNVNALDEIKEILIQLNTTMGSSAGHLSELVGVTEKQVRATKRLDPNVSVR